MSYAQIVNLGVKRPLGASWVEFKTLTSEPTTLALNSKLGSVKSVSVTLLG